MTRNMPRDDAAAIAALLDEIAADFAATARTTGLAHLDRAVAGALRRVPRAAFVADDERAYAYDNRPLPIGHAQTISQPFIVALMTQLAAVGKGSRVLEIGTGSGYQAAVLAELGAHVWSIEIVDALAESARATLARLGYMDVEVRAGDGNLGWPEQAPFDAIVVTAGGAVPPALLAQLAVGGRLVIPVDMPDGGQQLTVIVRESDDRYSERRVLAVRFVPITGRVR